MHISDGVLSGSICIGSSVAAGALVAYSLKRMKNEDIPSISVMTAAFFVASLIHVKIGPSSAHLLLNGLVGIILGISSFPAILVALLLHAIMFQHGGMTTLGVNSLVMGLPALIAYIIFKLQIFFKSRSVLAISILSFISGSISVILTALLTSSFLMAAGSEFFDTAKVVLIIHAPISVIEGFITLFIISFLYKVKPEMIK